MSCFCVNGGAKGLDAVPFYDADSGYCHGIVLSSRCVAGVGLSLLAQVRGSMQDETSTCTEAKQAQVDAADAHSRAERVRRRLFASLACCIAFGCMGG